VTGDVILSMVLSITWHENVEQQLRHSSGIDTEDIKNNNNNIRRKYSVHKLFMCVSFYCAMLCFLCYLCALYCSHHKFTGVSKMFLQ